MKPTYGYTCTHCGERLTSPRPVRPSCYACGTDVDVGALTPVVTMSREALHELIIEAYQAGRVGDGVSWEDLPRYPITTCGKGARR